MENLRISFFYPKPFLGLMKQAQRDHRSGSRRSQKSRSSVFWLSSSNISLNVWHVFLLIRGLRRYCCDWPFSHDMQNVCKKQPEAYKKRGRRKKRESGREVTSTAIAVTSYSRTGEQNPLGSRQKSQSPRGRREESLAGKTPPRVFFTSWDLSKPCFHKTIDKILTDWQTGRQAYRSCVLQISNQFWGIPYATENMSIQIISFSINRGKGWVQ